MNILSKINKVFTDARNNMRVNIDMGYIKDFYNTYSDEDVQVNVKMIKENENKRLFKDSVKQIASVEFKDDKVYMTFAPKTSTIKSALSAYNNFLTIVKSYFPNFDPISVYPRVYLDIDDSDRFSAFITEGLGLIEAYCTSFDYRAYQANHKRIAKSLSLSKKFNEYSLEVLEKHIGTLLKKDVSKFLKNIKEGEEEFLTEKHIEEVTSMELPSDWYNTFLGSEDVKGVFASSSQDGLVLSLNNLGHVDIEYISQITGLTLVQVIKDLKGVIYQNPEKWDECFYKGWETLDEYVSGNVLKKYKVAYDANKKYKGYFEANVNTLYKYLPEKLNKDDIYITLGSPWIPPKYIEQFIIDVFKIVYSQNEKRYNAVVYNSDYGIWEISNFWKNKYTFANHYTYGTNRLTGLAILEHTLNSKNIVIYDTHKVDNNKVQVLNKNETLLAKNKQEEILASFNTWLLNNPSIRRELVDIYTETYCNNVVRHYDGSYLQFNDMNPDIELYDYQKNAVARILNSPNTLLAHDVGAGKTLVMIASGMEKRRLGLSKKNLYIVPNNIIGQWADMFKEIYPNSNILVVEPKIFTPAKREETLKKICNNDYDAIIMTYSCFRMIPLSKKFYIDKLNLELEKISRRIRQIKKSSKEYLKKYQKGQEDKKKLEEQLAKVDETIYFDKLGITGLFVDEAHNYKNLKLEATNNTINGCSSGGSQKCQDLYDKIRSIQRNVKDSTIVFATGTPITNSLTDIFVMQKYLQEGSLKFMNLQNFDSWVGMFAEKKTKFEIDVDTNSYRMVTRYDKFHNIPELSSLLSMVTDFYQIERTDNLPENDGYIDVVIKKSLELNEFLQNISLRADKIRNKKVKRDEDNMLKITTDGRKAALDIRLVYDFLPFTTDSKVYFCAENIYTLYQQTKEERLTQIVFCDSSTPKKEFNVYDSLKSTLVSMGIPEKEIVYIHDCTTDKQKNDLYNKVRKGDVRVIIGSTPKLGLGVNIQDKLVALHHLDIPWRPSDMIQREGRILRAGNQNDKIYIYRYITDGSFDAYSWQLLENKQRIIREILSGSVSKRKCDELDDVILNYAEVKALSIGNPLLKERVEVSNNLNKYSILQKKLVESKHKMEVELLNIPNKITSQEELIQNLILDKEYYNEHKCKYSPEERQELRKKLHDTLLSNELNHEEIFICNYNGFDIYLPTNSSFERMYVIVRNNNDYFVEMKDTEVGMLIRLDNFLESFDKTIEKEEINLSKLVQRQNDLKVELAKEEDYSSLIVNLQTQLNEIDIKLGVNYND